MAISRMSKVIVSTWRGEASRVIDALQHEGIMQILNSESSMIAKEWPDLHVQGERARELEELLGRLDKAVAFLDRYHPVKKGLLSALAPRAVVDAVSYREAVHSPDRMQLLECAERTSAQIESLHAQHESLRSKVRTLTPWRSLEGDVQQLWSLRSCSCSTMLIPDRHLEEAKQKSDEIGAILQEVGSTDGMHACVIVTAVEKTADLQKAMRTIDAESVSFEGMKGTVAHLIAETESEVSQTQQKLNEQIAVARQHSRKVVKLGILADYTRNLLSRELARRHSPATDQVVFFEGWVRDHDFKRLEKLVSKFTATSVSKIEPAPDETIPVEIENNRAVRPFEVITRLYGMPQYFEVDPTALLSPFFAIYFALCLTDAGYGLILVAFSAWLLTRLQGDKKFMWLLLICSALTVVAGALTGGWFGDGAQVLADKFGWEWLGKARLKMMWFDPFARPMLFFAISIGLGYIQIMTGIITAFVHNLRRGKVIAAVCDQLTWLVMLNCLILYFAAGKAPFLSAKVGYVAVRVAIVPAAMIFLFSQREGGWVSRLGLGAYQLFSTVFFIGDLLSYLRLMALGMVTGGLAMSVNVVAQNASGIKYVGFIAAIVILIVGHLFNTAINALGAFVHSVRLQFVEFFPKFITGGGRQFSPLATEYKHVYITEKSQMRSVVK